MTDKPPTTIGACYACKRGFAYDPQTVTLFPVDPETGLPPGMTVLGSTREPSPEALARAVRKPVCPDCVRRAEQFKEASERVADPSAGWKSWPPGGDG
ncbi:hypothetical protein Ssi03_69860 [Sphaerisporangium siamense]|uniref:Uncharacterized protein n=1 Tax=Sphaerisporangium siamense TaxID=795645 RepID=A0A7W7GBE7_9ACTN|nr:hypothetical protein [Sphaerisporangium siamense]MBB4702369.1 hypothetical protein [Sphaerisporangium siamense]GII88996.1 hypothetical protein Ssi03_69860 [Sphaerisporangium siamense]